MLRRFVGMTAAWLVVGVARGQTFSDAWGAAGLAADEANQGVALGDQDGDGRPDLFLASIFVDNPIPFLPDLGGPNRLYRNGGSGTFSEVGAALGLDDRGQGQGAAWGDYDNDGRSPCSTTVACSSTSTRIPPPCSTCARSLRRWSSTGARPGNSWGRWVADWLAE
jgi:hypothetical protein